MTTIGACIVSRNDNYGGNLKERAAYALNSAIETYDEIVYVDYNSRDKTLVEEIEDNLIHRGNLLVIKISNNQHKEFTKDFENPQPCSEVLGRNIGIRRLSTDFIVSTNVDDIQPLRWELSAFTEDIDTMFVIARRGLSIETIKGYNPKEINELRESLDTLKIRFPQAWLVQREPWSLVEWCGDFQIAHSSIWDKIRGFEEWQLGAGVNDSYVLRKTKEMGFKTDVDFDRHLYHIDHGKGNDYGETCNPNLTDCLYGEFLGTRNTENWGYANVDFEAFRL